MIRRTTIREIKQSFGRYFAIAAIIALGVGFFAGLKVTRQAMIFTGNEYLEELQLFDLRLISTLGFKKEDLEEFRKQKEIQAAEGSVSIDMLYINPQGNESVMKVHSYLDKINQIVVTAGRLPEKADECVVDSNLYSKDWIGKTVKIADSNNQDTKESFAYQEYTIVGIVQSSYYINFERGTTALGNGKVSGFMYLLPEGFATDYFTEIFVTFENKDGIYTKEYEDYIEKKSKEWEDILLTQVNQRYQSILFDANEELEKAKQEFQEKKEKAEKELKDAQKELEDADREIIQGEEKIKEAEDEIQKNQKELEKSETQVKDKKEELVKQEKVINQQEQQLKEQEEQLKEKEQQLKEQEEQLKEKEQQLKEQENVLAKKQEELTAFMQMTSYKEEKIEENEEIKKQADLLKEMENELAIAKEKLAAARQKITDGKAQLAAGKKKITDGKAQITAARQKIADGRVQLQSAEEEIADGKKKLEEGKKELETQKEELSTAKQETKDGWSEYRTALKEYEEETKKAEKEIKEAEEEIEKVKEPDSFALDRNTNIGYISFENDSNIVEGVANVFPIFFFLVAALVCITTMNRMVEEQRTQIGVLKALGYHERTIMNKYMFYSGSAAITGCILGFFLGTYVFPMVIWKAYNIMYHLGEIRYVFNPFLAIISLLVSLLCSLGTTWLSCRYELQESAANLMRPKSPKAGKRILLEYIPIVWKRLKFLHKVTLRNIFRYKKRFLMMIIGISGCTALLLTGFGVEDSIVNIASQQFEEIQVYNASVGFKEAQNPKEETEFTIAAKQNTESFTFVYEKSVDLVVNGKVKSISMVILEQEEQTDKFVHMYEEDGTLIEYPNLSQAVISNRIAEDYHISVGDEIIVRDEEMREIKAVVSGIFKNFVYNYIYLNKATYQEQIGKEPEYKTVYFNVEKSEDAHQAATVFMNLDSVSTVSVNADMAERIKNMMSSLDAIVLLIIICAAFLAFIVLYNLTNINITERIREIATIKVLGFYKRETAAYVFRENILLTVIGGGIGLILGRFLHAFVMAQIKVDMVSFDVRIAGISYFYSIFLTFAFTLIVNAFMSFKLEKINMAESLKSVD